ncbi:D-alanyl-D-alanine carboxypeptidase [Tsukamurella ocularis]|nr:D-alanyl-D-alanine carboxypeptidase [Tsukamurella ocularis]MCS3853249.1 D-alanyl-D-alanine carboxypeptidase [Tsukamurella ocularis]
MVLQLVDEGKVQLDAPLRRYLPQLPGNSTVDPSRITVREALHHQSGFPEYLNEPELLQAMQPGPPAFSPDQLIQLALRHPAQFSPGTQTAYVNTNYIVAGMIVEAVTRRSFSNEVHDRIAAPLGLRDTTFPPPQESDIAGVHGRGYELVDGRSKVIDDVEPSATWTAGAMISTGADLTTFIAALARGRVIPLRLMLEQNSMTSSHELPVPGTRYGLGLMEFHLRCGITVRGHVGDIPGFHSVAAATLNGQHSASIVLTQEPTGAGTATWPIQMLEAALCAG